MKKLISLILSIVMMLTTFSVVGFAIDEPFAYGVVADLEGGEFSWELSEDGGTLTINGNGYMGDFEETPLWLSYNFNKLIVGEGVKSIGEEAFLNAKNLETVELASTVETIGQRAFYDCDKLKSIDLAEVSSIGSMAFYGCMLYTEIKIPETVNEIEPYAFGYYCNEELDDALAKIDNVTIFAKENTLAQKYAEENEISFINLSDYTEFFEYLVVDASILTSEPYVMLISYKGCPYSTDIIIPEEIDGYKVGCLAENLFSGSDVTSVYIPATVREISENAFENASELTEIICEEGGKYISVDGVLYNTDGYILLKVPEAKTEINQYPENIRTIYENSFRNSVVKEVVLPETVVNIREYSFAFSGVEKIVIPEGVELISEFAFHGSENLKDVVLPDSLVEIGANAFGNCPSLTEINLPYGIECIEGAAFHCTGLKSVVIPDSVKRIGDYAFGYYSADDIEFVKDKEFEIQGRSGTAAEEYAIVNGFKFTDVSPEQPKIRYAYADKVAITLFWEEIDGVDGYEIYRKIDDHDYEKIAEIGVGEETVYSDINVDNGQTYTYAVVSVKGNMRSSYEKSVTIEFINLATPKLVSAEMTLNGIYVKWKTVSNAEGYILYRRTEDTEWEEIADFKGKVKSYEDATCESGNVYYYTVKAYKGAAESGYDYEGVSSVYLTVPKLKSATNATKGIKITWTKVKGATGYIIGRRTSSSGWTKIATLKNVDNYIDKTAKAGTEYTYTVVPVCDGMTGIYDTTGIRCKRIAKVVLESATNTENGVKISWDPVSKCTGYKVYRKTGNGSYKLHATGTGAEKSYYIDKRVKSGTKYTYKVVAFSGDYTSYYTEASVYYLNTPELLSVKSSKSGVTAKWEAVKGASGYQVFRKEGSGKYKKIATVKGGTKKSYLDKSAKKGKTYTYKVKAYYSKTTSAYSNAKKVTDKY